MNELLQLFRTNFDLFAIKVAHELNPTHGFRASRAFAAMTHALDRLAASDGMRLVINVPPRNGKSILASVALPCFLLGRDPSLTIICASYSMDLATKFSRDSRAIMQTAWYQQLFPGTILGNKVTETELQTTQYGGRLAASVCGTLTGRGGDVIIIDDPMKGDDAESGSALKSVRTWHADTLASRADNKSKSRQLLVMQRLHQDDLSGHLLASGQWEHLSLPAIATEPERIPVGPNGMVWTRQVGDLLDPEQEPLNVLESLRHEMGTRSFSAQYLQDPMPETNDMFHWDWFRTYSELPSLSTNGMRWFASWDLATKPGDNHDWTVGVIGVLFRSNLYIKDVKRFRGGLPDVLERMKDVRREYPGIITIIEDAGNGPAAHQTLQREGVANLRLVKPVGAKDVRFYSITPAIEKGRVHIPASAPWLPEFKREILGFPKSKHDDQVDALSQLIKFAFGAYAQTGVMDMRA